MGKQVEFTVPDYSQNEDCDDFGFRLWEWSDTSDGSFFGDSVEGPNERRILQILDVDGTRLVISASYFPDTSPQDQPTSTRSWRPSGSGERQPER